MASERELTARVLNNFFVRLVFLLLVIVPALGFIGDLIYPNIPWPEYTSIANKVGLSAAEKLPTTPEVLEQINNHRLAWLYITTGEGEVLPQYKQLAPDLPNPDIISRNVQWRGHQYYEATSHAGNNRIAHVGFKRMHAIADVIPTGFAIAILLIFAGGVAATYYISVQQPLTELVNYYKRRNSRMRPDISSTSLTPPLKLQASSELRLLPEFIDEMVEAARMPLEAELASARNDLADYLAKELEDKVINRLSRDIEPLDSSSRICNAVTHKVNDEYPTFIKCALAFQLNENKEPRVTSYVGFSATQAETFIPMPAHPAFREALTTGQLVTLGQADLKNEIFARIASDVTNAIILPITFQNREMGFFVFFFSGDPNSLSKIQRFLKKVAELVSKTLYRVTVYEQEFAANRTDQLTGLPNRKYLNDSIPQLFDQLPQGKRFAALLIEGDNFMALNDQVGRQGGDQLIKQLSLAIKDAARLREQGVGGEFGDQMFRYGAAQFVLLLEDLDRLKAHAIAERVRLAIEAKNDWANGIPLWTASIGIAIYPEDAAKGMELINGSEIAMAYIKDQKRTNSVCLLEQVPKPFRAKKQGSNLGGSLEVFDAGALLQSVATSRKTGILEVVSKEGRLWTYLEDGRPVKAKLGRLGGDFAIVQYLCTFEDGDFNFKEWQSGSQETVDLPLGNEFNVTKSTEKLLLDGALARDNFNAAKLIIPKTTLFALQEKGMDKPDIWMGLAKQADGPSREEISVMSEIFKMSQGNLTLDEIFARLEHIPPYMLWRAAALLLQNRLFRLTGIRGYGTGQRVIL